VVDSQVSNAPRGRGSIASLMASWALLAIALTLAGLIAGTVASHGFSAEAVQIGTVAASVCWCGAALALAATFVGTQLGLGVQGVLLGMMFRLGLPLLAVIGFSHNRAMSGAILGVYLVALVIETLLSLRMTPPLPVAKAS
jgi:hypothetical protein